MCNSVLLFREVYGFSIILREFSNVFPLCVFLSFFFFFFGFHAFIGAIRAEAAPCQLRRSQFLQARSLGVLGVAGHVGHVPVVLEGHWVVAGCGPVDHERVLGVGAECGQDYSEAHNGEGCH